MPVDYTITLSDAQDARMQLIAAVSGKTVQQVLDEQALFRIQEQIDVWCGEAQVNDKALTRTQRTELETRLQAARDAFYLEIQA